MKKILLLLFIISVISVKSQITITSTSMPNSGDTIRYSNASLASLGDYTVTGTNQFWDFSSLVPTSQAIRKFEPAFSTPYIFFGTGYGEKTADSIGFSPILFKNIYSFYKKSSSKFYVDGIGMTFSGIPIPNFYSDKDELYLFPLHYTDRDSSTFKFSTVTTGSTIPSYSKQGYRITEADGWGKITTPYGSDSCLRIVTTQYSQDSIKGSIAIGTFTIPLNIGFPNYTRSYQWLTLGERIPYLEVTGTLIAGNFVPAQVKYRDIIRSFVGIKEESLNNIALAVFPNPASSALTIVIPESTTHIVAEIVDLQGKTVLLKDLNDNTQVVNQHQMDVSGLAKGLYILNLSNLSGKQSLKISIQ
ncbi:MAG: T9SS type A sorting domain-containing protein [Bacteroidetes bacterium]|nr:T9SS type A sorting domain-containing protein [Bacteroidota bacterium]